MTPGHPEYGDTPGVETTTGPLGQGTANAVGLALAESLLAARFNTPEHKLVDHFTYALVSDGDLMEGISHEAAELAGHQKLGKLVWVFDDNEITIEGSTRLASSTNHGEGFQSYGWQVLEVSDGNDIETLDLALRTAQEEPHKPSLIVLKTTIAWGSPNKAGTAASHGAPLGVDEIQLTKEAFGYPSQEPFWVAEEARAEWAEALPRGQGLEREWQDRMDSYRKLHPELAEELEQCLSGTLPDDWNDGNPDFSCQSKHDTFGINMAFS